MSYSSGIIGCAIFATIATMSWAIFYGYPFTSEYIEKGILSWVIWFLTSIILFGLLAMLSGGGHGSSRGSSRGSGSSSGVNSYKHDSGYKGGDGLSQYHERLWGRKHGYVG